MAAKGARARGCTPSTQFERGAAAVEMAFILPILLALVMGIIEFGHAYNTQISLTNAAREGVRVMAITHDPDDAKNAAKAAAVSIPGLQTTDMVISPAKCSAADDEKPLQVTLTINYSLETITGFAGPFNLTGKGVMLCGG
ncbi:TadE/TadG family type IV pilus assembly protein [Arthrobacter roseus]|uniref:TadE/TadG family type IV pilus assembly protein n=1 Tax=Arthrobacter roseus TaxID=136274 RepID=UPI003084452C|nr:Flp pilus assembly protein TadG [Arthrobacter roseus]